VTAGPELPAWIDPLLAGGDGTVPRLSAIPIELSDAYRDSFVPERHGSLQRNRSVLDDVRGRLEQMQVRGLRAVRGPGENPAVAERPAISLDVDDLYLAGEPVTLRARLVNAQDAPGPLRARIEPAAAQAAATAVAAEFTGYPDGWMLALDELPPGLPGAAGRCCSGSGTRSPPAAGGAR